MITNMLGTKIFNQVVIELPIRGIDLKICHVLITQSSYPLIKKVD